MNKQKIKSVLVYGLPGLLALLFLFFVLPVNAKVIDLGAAGDSISAVGRMGLGTNVPDAKLQVNATEGLEALRLVTATDWSPFNIRDNTDSFDIFRIDQTGTLATGTIPWLNLSDFPSACSAGQFVSAVGDTLTCSTPAGGVAGTGTTNYLSKWTGASTLGDSLIFDDGTNVGIGTATPVYKLSVNGDINLTGTLRVNGSPFSGSQWTTSGSNIYYNAGNVGIGTTTPNNLLQAFDLISFNNTDQRTQIGYQAGKYDLGQNNTWLGYQAGSANNATGKTNAADNNTALGYQALYSHTTGFGNTALGSGALDVNTSGSSNVAIGSSALGTNINGTRNVAVGDSAFSNNSTGNNNTVVGYSAVGGLNGNNNTAVGFRAGQYYGGSGTNLNSIASDSVYIGNMVRASALSATNEIIIGSNAVGSGSNSVTLGDDSITKTILKGSIGIGTTNPVGAKVHIASAVTNYALKVDYFRIGLVGSPVDLYDAANKTYVDSAVTSASTWTLSDNKLSTFSSAWNVGIGTTNPTERLVVAGNVVADAFYYSSDKNLKKNITTLSNGLEKIMQMRGVSFDWIKGGERNVGFIAQEVEKIMPELVKTDQMSGLKSVQYGNVTAILVEAVKEQQREINSLKQELKEVKQSIKTE